MGKSWKKDKTVSKQRQRNSNAVPNKKVMHFQEFEYDDSVDGTKYIKDKELDNGKTTEIPIKDKLSN
jgi:hypothetical protein